MYLTIGILFGLVTVYRAYARRDVAELSLAHYALIFAVCVFAWPGVLLAAADATADKLLEYSGRYNTSADEEAKKHETGAE